MWRHSPWYLNENPTYPALSGEVKPSVGELDAVLDFSSPYHMMHFHSRLLLTYSKNCNPITLFPVQCLARATAMLCTRQQRRFHSVQIAFLLALMWIQHPSF